jgi:hypothetical protein
MYTHHTPHTPHKPHHTHTTHHTHHTHTTHTIHTPHHTHIVKPIVAFHNSGARLMIVSGQYLVVLVTLPTTTQTTGYHDRKVDSKIANSRQELKYKMYWNEHCNYVLVKVGDVSFVRPRERYDIVRSGSRNTP